MNKSILFTAVVLLVVSPFASAQLGIFDQTADWGGPDSPPQRGTYKAAGSVDVTGSGADAVYTIRGNGDDIWENNDEGFYVYSDLSGSWRISAKVYWEDPGSNEWSKVGVMIRDVGNDATSKHFMACLRGADYGDSAYTQYRASTGGSSSNVQIYEDEEGTIPVLDFGDGLYLRVTRYSAINMLVSEYSYDGEEWFPAESQSIEMSDEVAYGIFITSHVDDENLVEATVSDVALEEVANAIGITRKLDAGTFLPGQEINVTLDVINPSSDAVSMALTETPPAAFTVSNISDGGAESGGTITWDGDVPSGASTLSYTVTVPANYDPSVTGYSADWSGAAGDIDTIGASALYLVDVSVGDEIFSYDFEDASQVDDWTDQAGFWDIDGGLFYELEDADGPLVSLVGDPSMTDYVITVQGMGLVADADWGIAYRGTDIGNFYSWQFYNGYIGFLKYAGGTRTEVLTIDYPEELNVWQEFRVIVKGDVHYLYFDGELQTIVEDSDLASGQVGFFGWINSGSDLGDNVGGIAFDNLVVSEVADAGSDVSNWSVY